MPTLVALREGSSNSHASLGSSRLPCTLRLSPLEKAQVTPPVHEHTYVHSHPRVRRRVPPASSTQERPMRRFLYQRTLTAPTPSTLVSIWFISRRGPCHAFPLPAHSQRLTPSTGAPIWCIVGRVPCHESLAPPHPHRPYAIHLPADSIGTYPGAGHATRPLHWRPHTAAMLSTYRRTHLVYIQEWLIPCLPSTSISTPPSYHLRAHPFGTSPGGAHAPSPIYKVPTPPSYHLPTGAPIWYIPVMVTSLSVQPAPQDQPHQAHPACNSSRTTPRLFFAGTPTKTHTSINNRPYAASFLGSWKLQEGPHHASSLPGR